MFQIESMFSKIFTHRSSIPRRWIHSSVTDLYQGLIRGDRGCLARSITLVESTNPEKKQRAKELLGQVLQGLKQRQEKQPKLPISFRIGLRSIFTHRSTVRLSNSF